jgi:hypothetical protein
MPVDVATTTQETNIRTIGLRPRTSRASNRNSRLAKREPKIENRGYAIERSRQTAATSATSRRSSARFLKKVGAIAAWSGH